MKTQAAIQSFLYNRRSLNRRPTTIRWYEKTLKHFALEYSELPTEPEEIERFLVTVVPDEKEEARHAYYRSLKAFYRFICRRHRIPNPMELIDAPARHKKIPSTLTSEELYHILDLAQNPRDRAVLMLFIDSGARAGEVASLRWENIFEDYIKVNGKTSERQIPISDETRRMLLSLSENREGWVFTGQRGHITTWWLYHLVQGYMRRAGIKGPKMGPHRLRHAFGKNYIVNGGDTRSLQEIMGHANISTTEIYVKLSESEIRAKHHQFTPLRSAHAAAQSSMDAALAVQEAEAIVAKKGVK